MQAEDSIEEFVYDDEADSGIIQTQLEESKINELPFIVMGAIIADSNTDKMSQKILGTGCLIGQDLVLTVAHNVYDTQKKFAYQNIIFFPKLHGEVNEEIKVIDMKIEEEYKKLGTKDYRSKRTVMSDYALLKLERKIPLKKYLNLAYNFHNSEEKLLLFGYSGLKKHGQSNKYIGKMEGSYGEAQKSILSILSQQKIVHHLLPTRSGQSGSPVILKILNQYYINSIHKAGVKRSNQAESSYGASRLITCDLIQNLKIWSKEMKSQIKSPIRNYLGELSYRVAKKIQRCLLQKAIETVQLPASNELQKCVGVVTSVYKGIDTPLIGCGFAISENLVLTSMSSIYHPIYKKYATISPQTLKSQVKITFSIGQNLNQTFEVESFEFNPGFLRAKSSSKKHLLTSILFDCCLLKLKTNLNLSAYFELTADYELEKKPYQMIGYNITKQEKIRKTLNFDKKAIHFIKQGQTLIYRLETGSGMSGSPIIIDNRVIGYHKCKLACNQLKAGCFISLQLLDTLFKWQNQLKGQQFSSSIYKQQRYHPIINHSDLLKLNFEMKNSRLIKQ